MFLFVQEQERFWPLAGLYILYDQMPFPTDAEFSKNGPYLLAPIESLR